MNTVPHSKLRKIPYKRRQLLVILGTIFIFAAIPVTVVLIRQNPQLISQAAPGDELTVSVNNFVKPFTKQMLGQAMVNWEHAWGKPFPNEVPGLIQATREQGVGLIRYAGGLWANDVGFDRTDQRIPYTSWTNNGNTYYFHYGVDELDSLNRFADEVGAEVMIQVNISTYDPAMWADMVRYTNIERGFNFKYWELGNELDFATDKGVDPDTYVTRMKAYIDAIKAVDPSVKIISGVPASAHDAPRQGYNDAVTSVSHFLTKAAGAVTNQGRKTDDLSYHWYQACNSSSTTDLFRWAWDGVNDNSWRNNYVRKWSEIIPVRIENEAIGAHGPMRQGITELNFDACNYDNPLNGNHLNALWASDVIGRLAYNGLDFITWYEGYANQGYATIYANNGDNPTQLFLRPSYYAFYMYNKYFGDQMVQASSYNNSDISIWASTDSDDPNKLKLRITNLTGNPITAPVNLVGTNATSGFVYTLSSTNPTDTSTNSNTASAPTTINGVKLQASDVVASAAAITPVNLNVNGTSFNYTFPAYTSTAIVLNITSVAVVKPGDINNDNLVNIIDLSILISRWGSTNSAADLNKNGRVDIEDLSLLLSRWGT